jgi:hypothetical protein
MITGRIPKCGIKSHVGNDLALRLEKETDENPVDTLSRVWSVLPF